jgi:hypothetical protein
VSHSRVLVWDRAHHLNGTVKLGHLARPLDKQILCASPTWVKLVYNSPTVEAT